MSTHLKDKVEKIQQIIAKLIEESAKNKPIIVEGKKDAQALIDLGIKGKILTVKTGGKSFLEATTEIEKLNSPQVILLLDFDRRGKEGTKRLKCDLERLKIKVNIRFWHDLRGLTGHENQFIESLPNYIRTLREKAQAT